MPETREKKYTFDVKFVINDGFDVIFDSPCVRAPVSVRLSGPVPAHDFDLLRQIVRYARDNPGPKAADRKLAETIDAMKNGRLDARIRGRDWGYGDLQAALFGIAEPQRDPVSQVPTATMHSTDAKMAGYAAFNRGPHLCVDAPDGNFTITVRTSEGKKVTFAFCPYCDGGPAQCVDVMHHTSGATIPNGDADIPTQEIIAFSVGRDAFRSTLKDDKPVTTLTVLLRTLPLSAG